MSELVATLLKSEGQDTLCSPSVGLWLPRNPTNLVVPGMTIGALKILGRSHLVVVPPGANGLFQARDSSPVAYGDSLGEIVDHESFEPDTNPDGESLSSTSFNSPTSGRFYARPTPEKPVFVEVGDVIEPGQVVCLLEVMKTFNRIEYTGTAKAKVLRVLPKDGDDLESGDPMFEIEEI